MSSSYKLFAIAVLAGWVLASTVRAESGTEQADAAHAINAANALLRGGKIDEAIEAYRQVPLDSRHRDELNYNLAVAVFRKGEIDSARELFTAGAAGGNAKVASRSRYNLGNCFYSDALQQQTQDPAAAIDSLRKAISHYRGALRGNPSNVDARANIELAAQLLRQLEARQEQDKQQQNQSDREQQQEEQQQNENDQQQQEQDQQQGQSNQQRQREQDSAADASDSQQGDQGGEQSQATDQENESAGSQESQEQSSESKSDGSQAKQPPDSKSAAEDSNNQANEQSSNAAEAEETPSEQLSQEPTEGEPRNQTDNNSEINKSSQMPPTADQQTGEQHEQASEEVPAGELTATAEQQAEEDRSGAIATGDPGIEDGMISKEEALKMLQAVRDRDMLRRLRLEQRERSRRIPVDRDW